MKNFVKRYDKLIQGLIDGDTTIDQLQEFIKELAADNVNLRALVRNQRNQLRGMNKMIMLYSKSNLQSASNENAYYRRAVEAEQKLTEFKAAINGKELAKELRNLPNHERRWKRLYEAAVQDLANINETSPKKVNTGFLARIGWKAE